MRAVIQRVKHASVTVEGRLIASIGQGLLLLIGIEESDTFNDIEWLAPKIAKMRIFDDSNGVMNCSVEEIQGELLAVSQFTLMASTKKGNRPSYIRAAKGAISQPLYDQFCTHLEEIAGITVKKGVFGADMKVELLNDGPVTILIDTKNKE